MFNQRLNCALRALAKAPKYSLAVLYIDSGLIKIRITNLVTRRGISTLDYLIGAAKSDYPRNIAYQLPKLDVTSVDTFCDLNIEDGSASIQRDRLGVRTITRLHTSSVVVSPLAQPEIKEVLSIDNKFISNAVEIAAAASGDYCKLMLLGLSVSFKANSYSLAATDGVRLSYTDRLPSLDDDQALLVAQDLEMIQILAKGEKLLLSNNCLFSDQFIYYPNIGVEYPDFTKLLRDNYTHINLGSTAQLIKKIKKLKGVKSISLNITADNIQVISDDQSTTFDHAVSNHGLTNMELKFNRQRLIKCLISKPLYMGYTGDYEPVVFAGAVNHLLMPMQRFD